MHANKLGFQPPCARLRSGEQPGDMFGWGGWRGRINENIPAEVGEVAHAQSLRRNCHCRSNHIQGKLCMAYCRVGKVDVISLTPIT